MAARNGFIAVNSMTGKRPVLRMMKCKVDATQAYFPGDPVILGTNGQVAIATAAVSGLSFVGVIDSLYLDPGNDMDALKALTFNQPNAGPYLATGQTGWALVNVDPEQLYTVQLDVTASIGLIGQSCAVSAGTGNVRAGISGFNLKGSTLGTEVDDFAQIVDISPFEKAIYGRGDVPSGGAVVVRLNVARPFPLL